MLSAQTLGADVIKNALILLVKNNAAPLKLSLSSLTLDSYVRLSWKFALTFAFETRYLLLFRHRSLMKFLFWLEICYAGIKIIVLKPSSDELAT